MPALSRLRAARRHVCASPTPAADASDPVALLDSRASALSAGKTPKRVPVGDKASIDAALKSDGVVILTDLPGDASAPDYWARAAAALPSQTFGDELLPGEPPVAAIHQEFARSAQVRELQAKHGIAGVLHRPPPPPPTTTPTHPPLTALSTSSSPSPQPHGFVDRG